MRALMHVRASVFLRRLDGFCWLLLLIGNSYSAGTAFKRSWAAGSVHTQIARSWTAAKKLRERGRAIRSPDLPLVHSALFTLRRQSCE